jgi:hypothetical protein
MSHRVNLHHRGLTDAERPGGVLMREVDAHREAL